VADPSDVLTLGNADRYTQNRERSQTGATATKFMSHTIHATFEDGVFKPDTPLQLPSNTRVRLLIEPLIDGNPELVAAWRDLEQLWEEIEIDSGSPPPTREELHDRH
jgi:predicted DNA-binding antitoxin AbrB/MazE fold protein